MSITDNIIPEAKYIVRTLVKNGYQAYIVGGAVRDLLLGTSPKDYDITTSARPEQVRAVFGRRQCRIIGRRFRLAHVTVNGELFEVSTFRKKPDENQRKGRYDDDGAMIWSDNVFGTLEEDAERRDFTVNALYLDVVNSDGTILDFSDGQTDLKKGIVRCIGDPTERLAEDPVRMLRALKLVANFDFRLEPKLAKAISSHLEDITKASSSRLFEELLKLVTGHQVLPVLELLHKRKMLKYLWPTLDQCWNEREGKLTRQLLEVSDKMKLEEPGYPPSKALALSIVTLPFIMSALNPPNPNGFWKSSGENDKIAKQAINLLFDGYLIPKLFAERIHSICFLIPKLLQRPLNHKIHNHNEYKYGKLLLKILYLANNWNQETLNELP